MKRLAGELRSLAAEPEDCIEAQPCEDNVAQVRVVLTGPSGTPYYGGRFEIILSFGGEDRRVCGVGYLGSRSGLLDVGYQKMRVSLRKWSWVSMCVSVALCLCFYCCVSIGYARIRR